MEIFDAQLNGAALKIEEGNASELGAKQTSEEAEHAGDSLVQRLGNQNFYFHKNGRFSGVPTQPGEYTFKMRLLTRSELDIDWEKATESDEISVTLIVEKITEEILEQNAAKVETASEGYTLEQRATADTGKPLEEGDTFHMVVSHDVDDEFADFYVDGVKQIRHVDYEVYPCDPNTGKIIRLFDAGAITGTFIQSLNTTLNAGVHSLNLEFKHVDSLENTQTRNVSQAVSVKEKTVKDVTPVKTSYSGGGSGGSKTISTYSIKAAKVSNGTISLSATKIAAGQSVTITVTPNKGYHTEKVSVSDSQKKAVETKRDGNKYTFTMPKRNVTVSATFALSTYSVTASPSQHGKVSLNHSTAAPNATVNGTTTPDKGYLLSGVTVRDANGKSVKVETFNDGKFTFLMPSGKVTVSATFTVKRLASFVDIQGPDWFFDDAEWAYNRNILRGTTEQYWEPQSLMNSITSIVTLERLDGVDLTPYDTGADDGLDNSAWYVSALRWANANHITLSDRPFGGQDALTRGEFALMLCNYLRYRGITPSAPDDLTFTDAAMMSEDELNAFLVLQKADVFRGYSDGSIRPKAYLSRAHLSALLHRLSNYIIQVETGTQ